MTFLVCPSQILVILRSRSVEGLSVTSFEIEALGYSISAAYSLSSGVPFSACGEVFFIFVQCEQ